MAQRNKLAILTSLLLDFFVVGPLVAFIYGWTARAMWLWFVKAQYGAGPTLSSYFGIFIIVGLATRRHDAPDEDILDAPILHSTMTLVNACIIALTTIALGHIVHAWFGWGS